jgi:hypothetical protein
MDEEPLIQKELHGTKPLKHRTEEEEIKVPTSQSSQMNRASRERISESSYPLVRNYKGKS